MAKRVPFIQRDRVEKARMIEAILADYLGKPVEGFAVLDIGCGNGQISDYFQKTNRVSSVDIRDRRVDKDSGVDFHLVDSERLPFDAAAFDVVISHHVLEHMENQDLHLEEIRRVLKAGGVCYLATPNRSSPIMHEHEGNEQVLRYKDMGPFYAKFHFEVTEYAVKCMKEPHRFHIHEKAFRFIPTFVLRRLQAFFPSHMFVLKPDHSHAPARR